MEMNSQGSSISTSRPKSSRAMTERTGGRTSKSASAHRTPRQHHHERKAHRNNMPSALDGFLVLKVTRSANATFGNPFPGAGATGAGMGSVGRYKGSSPSQLSMVGFLAVRDAGLSLSPVARAAATFSLRSFSCACSHRSFIRCRARSWARWSLAPTSVRRSVTDSCKFWGDFWMDDVVDMSKGLFGKQKTYIGEGSDVTR